jgi:hypothetical protein
MSRIKDFLIGKVLARLMGLQIQIDDQHITVRAKNARIANAIVSRLRERAIRENDQRILAMLREAANEAA